MNFVTKHGTSGSSMWCGLYRLLAVCLLGIFSILTASADEAWVSQDIGSVGVTGSSTYDSVNDTFTINGAGAAMTGTADGCQFAYLTLSGNLEIITKVVSLTGSNSYSEAGIMFRESLAAGARYVSVSASVQNGVSFGYRATVDAGVTRILGDSVTAPVWLRLVRSGTTLAGYSSTDGVNWELVGQVGLPAPMNDVIAGGLYVSNFDVGALASAFLTNISVLTNVPQRSDSLKLWLRSDVNVSLVASNQVSFWQDQSGNGNDAVQATTANQPTYIASDSLIGGRPSVKFAASDYLSIANSSGLNPDKITIIAVAKRDGAASGAAMVVDKGSDGSAYNLRYGGSPNGAAAYINGGQVNSAAPTGVYSVMCETYDLATLKLFLNGVAVDTASYSTAIGVNANSVSIGGRGTNYSLKGEVAELFLYGYALTDSERQDVEAYLYAKYGIGVQLVATTPTLSVMTGTYTEAQTVVLNGPVGSRLYYTLDGSTPTTASTLYTGAITIGSTTSLKVIAVKQGYLNSAVATAVITIDPTTNYVDRSGLQLWLKADTLAQASGTSVALWSDMSGKGNDVSQPTTASQPTYQANAMNGQPVVHFNGSTHWLSGATSAGLKPANITLISVYRPTGAGSNAKIIIQPYNDTGWSSPYRAWDLAAGVGTSLKPTFDSSVVVTPWVNSVIVAQHNSGGVTTDVTSSVVVGSGPVNGLVYYNILASDGTFVQGYDRLSYNFYINGVLQSGSSSGALAYLLPGSINTDSASTATGLNSPVLVVATYDGSFRKLYVNGVMQQSVVTAGVLGYGTGTTFRIGNDPSAGYLNGDIAEVLVYDYAISDLERQDVEAYVYGKYGVGTPPTVASPIPSVTTATYAGAQTVAVTVPVGAQVYYTLDGSIPTAASTLYTGPILISSTATLKVIAMKSGYQNSPVITSVITIDAATDYVPRNGLALWLRADTGVTSASNVVSGWADQSGLGNNASQSVAADQPALVTNALNGKPVVRFTASGTQFLSVANNTSLDGAQMSVMAVTRRATGTGVVMIAEKGNSSVGYSLRYNNATLANSFMNSNSAVAASGYPVTVGAYAVLAGVYDQATHKVYVNGSVAASNVYTTAVSSYASALTIGGRTTANSLDGDIAELFVFTRALSSAERRNLEAYLSTRYGISAAQPVAQGPTSSVPTGIYAGTQTVTLASPEGGVVRYTTDGSAPTASSAIYTGPITVSSTTTIRALSFVSGYAQSPETSVTLTIDGATDYVSRSGLALWLRADTGVTAVSGVVSGWSDQSGLGNNASQMVAADQPALVTNALNGKPVVRFTASGTQFLSVANNTSLDGAQMSVMAVTRRATGTGVVMIAEKGNSSVGYSLRYNNATLANSFMNSNSAVAASGYPVTVGAYAVLAGIYDQATHKVYVNGAVAASNAFTTAVTPYANALTIGGRTTANSLDGDIAELFVFTRALSNAERRNLESYLSTRYGIAAAQPLAQSPTSNILTGIYSGTQMVTLASPEGGRVRYTTDGSVPTASSTLYTGPITVGGTTTIRAISLVSGYTQSPEISVTLTIDATTDYVPRSGLGLWLRADTGVTAVSGVVSGWGDQSGNGNNATQTVAADQPSVVVGAINGKPVIRFVASATQFLSVANASSVDGAQMSMVAVTKRTSGSALAMVLEKGNDHNGYSLRYSNATVTSSFMNSSVAVAGAGYAVTTGSCAVLGSIYDQGTHRIYVNGGLAGSSVYTAAVVPYPNAMTIGGRSASYCLDGDIAELFVFTRALSNAERRNLESYLSTRYGISAAQPLAQSPAASIPTGIYSGTQTVTLASPEGGVVRYTMDGSTPTVSSAIYTGPITVSGTTTIRAISLVSGYTQSPEISVTLTIDATTDYVPRSGLALWLRADTGVTAVSGAVSGWSDQSGLGNNASQTVAADQPALVANVLNGNPVVRFTGSQTNYLSVPDNASLDGAQMSVVAVSKRVSGTGTAMIAEKGNGHAGYSLRFGNATVAGSIMNDNSAGAGSGFPVAVGSYAVLAGIYDQVTNRIYVNGAVAGSNIYTGAVGPYPSPLTIGGRGTAYVLDGDIAELFVFTKALTEFERFQLEQYLLTRYGFSQKLTTPVFAVAGQTLSAPARIALQGPAGASIYYTTDGSTPTILSTLYTGPINVAYTQTIKAFSAQAGYIASDVTTAAYTLNSTLWPGPVATGGDTTAPVIQLTLPANAVPLP